MAKKIGVLLAKIGLDGHDLGIKLVARALRDAGMEVIYVGLNVTPAEAIKAAEQENVDIIGISSLSGSHLMITEKLMTLLKSEHMSSVKVVVGGIIPNKDVQSLKKMGVAEVFRPGVPLIDIANAIRDLAN